MASIVKHGDAWRVQVSVKGVRASGTFPTKAHARAWASAKEAEMRAGKTHADNAHTCADAFSRYEVEVSKGKRGYRWEALRLAAFSRSALGPVRMSELNETHIAAWRNERLRSVQGSTVSREMNILSNVFAIARKEWKWIKDSPTKDVSRPKENPPRDRRITPDEIERICIALGWQIDGSVAPNTKQQRVALAFLFAIETAMRAGEICALTVGSVVGRVARTGVTKNGEVRNVPLSPRALEIWVLVPDGFGITAATLDALFRKARERSGVEGLTFHDSRHEAITRLAGKIGVLDLARMVGHKDLKQLMTYYNISAHDIAGKL